MIKEYTEALAEIFNTIPSSAIKGFKTKNDLASLVNVIEPIARTIAPSELKDTLIKYAENIETNEVIKNQLENFATQLAYQINRTYETIINTIKPEITELQSSILKTYQKYLSQDGYSYLENDLTPDTSRIFPISYNSDPAVLENNVAITTLHQLANLKSSIPSYESFLYITQKFPSFIKNRVQSVDVKNTSDVVKAIKELCQKEKITDTAYIEILAKALFDFQNYNPILNTFYSNYLTTIKNKTSEKVSLGEILFRLSTYINDFEKFINAIDLMDFPFSSDITEELYQNLDTLKLVHNLYRYTIMVIDSMLDPNTLVLGTFRNNNTKTYIVKNKIYKKFLADGYKPEDLLNYLDIQKANTTIPFYGITYKFFKQTYDPKLIQELRLQKLSKYQHIKVSNLYRAFMNTLASYVKEHYDEQDIPRVLNMIKSYADKLQGRPENLNQVLYEFIIDTKYNNTFIQTLYKALNKSYIEALTQTAEESLDESFIDKIDTEVLAKLILSHLNKF